ncbi:hypothetical protein BH24CHL4_BH24CHL4_11240 [soil metagenome]
MAELGKPARNGGFGGTKSGNPTANTLDPVHARKSPALIRGFLRMGRVE